jgi:hypothetical protein
VTPVLSADGRSPATRDMLGVDFVESVRRDPAGSLP